MNSPRRGSTWQHVATRLGLIAGLILLLWQLWRSATAYAHGGPAALELGPAAIALALGLVGYFIQMASWHLLVQAAGEPVPLLDTLIGYPRTFVARYIPGGLWGYLSRSFWLRSEYGISPSQSWGLSIVEAAGLIGTCSLVPIADGLRRVITAPPATSLAVPIALFGALWLGLPWGVTRTPWGRAVFPTGLARGVWMAVLALDVGYWLCFAWAFSNARVALGAPPSSDWLAAMSTTGTAVLAGFAVLPVPGGLGVREATLSYLLERSPSLVTSNPALLSLFFRVLWSVSEVAWLVAGSVLASLMGRSVDDHPA